MKKSQSKIAVDVVLLPPDEIVDKAIEVNQALIKTFDNKIVLNKQNCFPHLSLAMGSIKKDDIPEIDTVLKDIAENFYPITLTISDICAETIPTGEKVSGFEIIKTKDLQLLHETVMNKLSPYFTYDVSSDMIYTLPNQQVEEVTTYWIENYPKESSFEKFSPHITIGIGEVEGETCGLKFPIQFNASKLALCHFGNYCTCREILLLYELKNGSPLVSIGMPVYNEEKYIRQALNSLLGQTYKNFELIISDNASTDRTQETCLEYTARDKRVRYYRNAMNMGALWNFNQVFGLSTGEYFMWTGAHDLWSNNYIRSCLETLKNDSSVVVAYPRTIWIDENNNELNIKSGFTDTRGCGVLSRFNLTLWTNQHAIYGVIRSDALKKTRLNKQMIGSGAVLLGELSILGEFAHVPGAVWYRRKNREDEHSDQHLARYRRMLFSSEKHAKAKLPYWKIPYEYLVAIRRGPLSFKQKVALTTSAIPSIFVQHGFAMFGDIRRFVRK
jgi:glycosyltransferase involved in cell wall biosynthesis/2'-5' RNA ligase